MSHTKVTCFFVLFVLSSASADAAEVRVKTEARIQGSLVRLGDLAEVQAADAEQRQRLEQLELYPAPAIGACHTVRQQEIREMLNLNGFDSSTVTVTGAMAVRLTSAPRKVTNAAALHITDENPPSTLNLSSAGKPVSGVIVTTRFIDRGEVLTEADLAIGALETKPRGLALVEQIEDAIGQELTRPLDKDQPLDSRYLQRPMLIRRGETVTVCARSPGVCVRTTAKALENGARDDLIMLESTDTRQRYSARVVGLQQAEVSPSATPVLRISLKPAPATPLR